MAKKVFVAATGQHKGKTTSTLGLVANLKERGYNVGYCKPVGQKYLSVDGTIADKDAVLFSILLKFNVLPEIHSPVILGQGITASFLDQPDQYDFNKQIHYAAQKLEENCDFVVYEGTGHSGVGSVVDLSNAKVAKMLKAGVVLVVGGGIGKTIDELNLNLSLFREEQVPIIGVIVNKVLEEKMDKVKFYVEKKLKEWDIPLLGVLPYDKTLSFPIVTTICNAVGGKVMSNHDYMYNQVEDILAGSLVDTVELKNYQNVLLVVSSKRFQEAVEKIKVIAGETHLDNCPLSAVLITGDGRLEHWYTEEDFHNEYLAQHKVPVITTTLDTYGSVVKISRIEVKINTNTPWKILRAIELIRDHVDMETIINNK